MTEKTKKCLRTVYYVLIIVALAAAAISLAVACLSIYQIGDHPFNPEIVGQWLSKIAIPLIAVPVVILLGFVLHPLLPNNDESDREMDRPQLARLQKQVSLAACPAELKKSIHRHRVLRIVLPVFTGIQILVATIGFGLFAMKAHPTNLNEVLTNLLIMLAWFASPLVWGIATGYLSRFSRKKEIALLKSAPAEAKVAGDNNSPCRMSRANKILVPVLRWGLLGLAVAMVLYGALGGGWEDVLLKAVAICAECIGLG